MQRYNQIELILKYEKPKSILEVGTWNGHRAIRMCAAAGCNRYIGFDLFGSATSETDKNEMNVKKHHSLEEVQDKLARAGIDALLVEGNTRETLPDFLHGYGGDVVDFAFIDGGHSVETIRNDYEVVRHLVKKDGVIIFDDYYANMPDGFDFTKYGANDVVGRIADATLLPSSDPVEGGGVTHLVVVRNKK